MRIGIIGAGHVGGTLGRRWAELGHSVTMGIRHEPDEELQRAIDASGGRLRAAPVADAVRDAEAVVLAVPWGAVQASIREAGGLDGAVVLDAINPLGPGLSLDVGPDGESGAERVAQWAPGARVVKVFNTTGYDNMADPIYDGARTFMPYAGDDAEAKGIAHHLATDLGFEAVDAGALVRARALENLAVLWIGLAMGGLGRNIAFRLVRR